MSQSCFSLGFLSQNYFWEFSTFCGYKGIYSKVCEKCEKSFFWKIGRSGIHLSLGQVASSNREITDWPNCPFLSSSAPAVVTLQLPACFTCVAFWQVISHEPLAILVARMLLNVHTFEIFTLSHTQSLHDSHLNIKYLIAELQANLAQNKANTWLNKFNLTRGNYNSSQSSKKNED